MKLNMEERRAVTKTLAVHYQKASKNEKEVIFEEFCRLTFYRFFVRQRGHSHFILGQIFGG